MPVEGLPAMLESMLKSALQEMTLSFKLDGRVINETSEEKLEKTIRRWVRTHLTYPCTRIGAYHFLPFRTQVLKACGVDCISDEALMETLEKIRDLEWPEMVYRAGLVPIYHRPSGAVMALLPDLVYVYVRLSDETNVHYVIPRHGSVMGMEDYIKRPFTGRQSPDISKPTMKRSGFMGRFFRRLFSSSSGGETGKTAKNYPI